MPADRLHDGLYLANRCVDIVFILDMLLQLRIAVKVSDAKLGTFWVTSPKEIARRYLTSKWFFLDFFSIATSLFDIVEFSGAKSLTALRAVRVLRLAKLIRLAKGSRVFKTWEMRMSINYAYLQLAQTSVMIVTGCHWFACLWGLQASFDPLDSWPGSKGYCVAMGDPLPEMNGVQPLTPNATFCPSGWRCDPVSGHSCVEDMTMYVYSLYFAIMTITSVGYGDIVAQPFNVSEQVLASLIMLFSGMIWGYLIGTFCGLAANLSPSVQAFRAELSRLNEFMSANALPPATRFRLREFMHESAHLRGSAEQRQLLSRLSPAMQGEVSVLVNQRWLSGVWYLRRVPLPGLLIELASILKPAVFPPSEFCPTGFLYIVQRGSAYWGGRVRRDGAVWGEDVLLDAYPALMLDFPALACSYLCVHVLNGKLMVRTLKKFGAMYQQLHRVRVRWVARRAFVRHAERVCFERGVPFRGRQQPIYAKEISWEMMRDRMRDKMRGEESASDSPPAAIEQAARVKAQRPHNGAHVRIEADAGTPSEARPALTRSRTFVRRRPAPEAVKFFDEAKIARAAMEFGLEMRRAQLDEHTADDDPVQSQLRQLFEGQARLEGQMGRIESALTTLAQAQAVGSRRGDAEEPRGRLAAERVGAAEETSTMLPVSLYGSVAPPPAAQSLLELFTPKSLSPSRLSPTASRPQTPQPTDLPLNA